MQRPARLFLLADAGGPMTLEDDANTMNSYDRFWKLAMRSAYQPLNAIEQAALLPLRDRWHYLNRIVGHEDHRPLKLNEGTPYESVFTVEQALIWAERLAS